MQKLASYKTERVDRLIPYAKNARTHSDEQVALIAASIREFGFTNPVLIDDKLNVIAGHGRIAAARKLGLAEVPVLVFDHMTETQRRAYVLADNQLAARAGWDKDLLALELGALKEADFDLDLLGFENLSALLATGTEGLTDPDDVPETPVTPVTELGDVWVMGRHRLVCGDSTDASTAALCACGENADLLFTSPPYAQQRDYKEKISNWDVLMVGVFGAAHLRDNAQIIVNLGLVHKDGEWIPYWDSWIEWMRANGWRRFGWYVWDQGPGMPGDWGGRLAPSHEFIFHFNRIAERARKTKQKLEENIKISSKKHGGMRKADGSIGQRSSPSASLQANKIPDSVIRVMRHKGKSSHPAMFPTSLAVEMIEAFSDPGDVVCEPFSGSGTTIIAAEMTGRACHAIELAPEYVDVAVKRWQDFTGQKAVRERDGVLFDDLAPKPQSEAA